MTDKFASKMPIRPSKDTLHPASSLMDSKAMVSHRRRCISSKATALPAAHPTLHSSMDSTADLPRLQVRQEVNLVARVMAHHLPNSSTNNSPAHRLRLLLVMSLVRWLPWTWVAPPTISAQP